MPVIVVQAADILPGNLPQQLGAAVEQRTFKASFDIVTWLNSFYRRGDFDGDGVPDYALFVTLRSDGKKGIAVWLSTKHQSGPTIIGAGKKSRVGAVIPVIGVSSTRGRCMANESFLGEAPGTNLPN